MSPDKFEKGTTLVVGATGFLGSAVVAALVAAGHQVRALARPTADPARVEGLRRLGADVVSGDLIDGASLATALQGVEAVVSSATAMMRPDTIEAVDRDGHLGLVAAAAGAGVARFVFVSFPPAADDFPLQRAKQDVEAALKVSGMGYTIVRPALFREVWLSPFLGFNLAESAVTVYGTGEHPVSYVALNDVGRFVAASTRASAARNQVLPFGGPEALTQQETIGIVERVTGKRMRIQHVLEKDLREQLSRATDSKERSGAGLKLAYAFSEAVDSTRALAAVSVTRESSVAFIEQLAGRHKGKYQSA